MGINFRLAVEEDCDELAEMRWAFRDEQGRAHEPRESFVARCAATLKDRLAGNRWAYWIAVQDGRIVATAFVERIDRVPSPEDFATEAFGYVTNVYARPEARNRGVGQELLRRLAAGARNDGIGSLILWPSHRAVPFYERLGFSRRNQLMDRPLP
ncbi:MAG TPA: GNAT family N-acetyltransferase [Deinococcales bacterium]|nr:GNAT family N-acetyltransferase [Deinococcales bacterium]